jgi:ABC-type amino acid transport substrate-binding protein
MQKENAEIFIRKNKSLKYIEINDLRTSCRILLKKNSPLTSKVNEILYTLQEDGTIKELKEKWFGKEQ